MHKFGFLSTIFVDPKKTSSILHFRKIMQKIFTKSKLSVRKNIQLKTKIKTSELIQFPSAEIIGTFDFLKSYVKNDCDLNNWISEDTEFGYVTFDKNNVHKCSYTIEEIE